MHAEGHVPRINRKTRTLCEFGDFRSGADEDSVLLGYDAASMGNMFQLTADATSYPRRTESSTEHWVYHAFPTKKYENETVISGM
jgi:hypothetical protein